jgi:hypothetical protein
MVTLQAVIDTPKDKIKGIHALNYSDDIIVTLWGHELNTKLLHANKGQTAYTPLICERRDAIEN